jgi:hypothetical protein
LARERELLDARFRQLIVEVDRDVAERKDAYADGTPKYRIVGTKEMVETDNYILDEIAAIREQVRNEDEHAFHLQSGRGRALTSQRAV